MAMPKLSCAFIFSRSTHAHKVWMHIRTLIPRFNTCMHAYKHAEAFCRPHNHTYAYMRRADMPIHVHLSAAKCFSSKMNCRAPNLNRAYVSMFRSYVLLSMLRFFACHALATGKLGHKLTSARAYVAAKPAMPHRTYQPSF
jgi:hypothetical protein